MSDTSDARYSLRVVVQKLDRTGKIEHEATATSHNLTLDETKAMQDPLLQVLGSWVKDDAE